MIIFLVILVFIAVFGGLLFLSNYILNAMGLRQFSDYPAVAKGAFYITWLLYNILGIVLVWQYGDEDALLCRRCVFNDYHAINYLILFSFYPFASTCWKFVRSQNRNMGIRVFSICSLVACYALFFGALFHELLGGASLKPGG